MLGLLDHIVERLLLEENLAYMGRDSETRFAEIGEIKEVGAGEYTFFWSGRKSEERR